MAGDTGSEPAPLPCAPEGIAGQGRWKCLLGKGSLLPGMANGRVV